MDNATFKLGDDRSKTGYLVSRKNDIRFELAVTPRQASGPWAGSLPGRDTVYFTDPLFQADTAEQVFN